MDTLKDQADARAARGERNPALGRLGARRRRAGAATPSRQTLASVVAGARLRSDRAGGSAAPAPRHRRSLRRHRDRLRRRLSSVSSRRCRTSTSRWVVLSADDERAATRRARAPPRSSATWPTRCCSAAFATRFFPHDAGREGVLRGAEAGRRPRPRPRAHAVTTCTRTTASPASSRGTRSATTSILEYEIPKYDGDLGSPNVFVPLEERHARRKAELLVEHFGSQRDKHWFTEDLFLSLMRAARDGVHAPPPAIAEAFYARKLRLDLRAPVVRVGRRRAPAGAPAGPCPACRAVDLALPRRARRPRSTPRSCSRHATDALGYPRGAVRLELCEPAGDHEHGVRRPSHDYSASYEETQAHSPRFREYATELVRDAGRAVTRSRAPTCSRSAAGAGDFLRPSRRGDGCRGDRRRPELDATRASPAAGRVSVVPEFLQPTPPRPRSRARRLPAHARARCTTCASFLGVLTRLSARPATPVVLRGPRHRARAP